MDRDAIEALIGRVAMGDRDAFSRLYDHTSGKLFAVSLRVLKDRASAEDAMQDAYIKVWRHAARYRATGHSPMTWLITIARNTAIDRLRTRRDTEYGDDSLDHLPTADATPEEAAIAASNASRIVACLNELETDRREAIKGAYLSGDSYADLAERFGIPLNTMRTWLRRGLASLRECMTR